MEQGRLFLALALSLLLMFGYQELVLKNGQHAETATPTQSLPAVEGGSPPLAAPIPAPVVDGRGFVALPSRDQRVVVTTDRFTATFTPRGGRLLDLELKGYKRELTATSPDLDLVSPGPVLPLTVMLGEKLGDAAIPYTVDRTNVAVTGDQTADVTFRWKGANGRSLEKHYHFRGDSYLFDLTATGTFKGQKPTSVLLTPIRPDGPHPDPKSDKAISLAARKLVERPTKDLLGSLVSQTETKWIGFSTQYFMVAAITGQDGGVNAASGTVANWPTVRLTPGANGPLSVSVFAGPKERGVLQASGHDLDRALDFGWFWFVALPLLDLLRLLYSVTGNYGVAIILLTALVRLVTVPLSQSSFRNMREMQKLQPQVERLKQKFKDDQPAFQKELMELYKRHRVNPLSGCLPMVLQLPVFVGLYNALYHAIELRHAPFMGWITDLSAPDRLMVAGVGVPVLTIVMGASMLVQQLLTPQQGDPSQRTMMMIMPLVFTFMFINFPAGLVLYWLVSNVLSITQQYYVTRMSD